MARTLIATYCEPQKGHLNWQLHALYLSFLGHASAGADFLATIPEGTERFLDPRIPYRFREPVTAEYRHPQLAAAGFPHGYPYVNHFLAVDSLPASYERIFLTDVDTLLLEPFSRFELRGFLTGKGAYSSDYSYERLAAFARNNGFRKFGRYRNVGATWFGPGAQVVECAARARELTKRLLFEEDWSDTAWPRWWIGVLTMYAAEIVLNENVDDLHIESQRIDARPDAKPNPAAIHLHMHHNKARCREEFSKHAFQEKFYEQNQVYLEGLAKVALQFARDGLALSQRQPAP